MSVSLDTERHSGVSGRCSALWDACRLGLPGLVSVTASPKPVWDRVQSLGRKITEPGPDGGSRLGLEGDLSAREVGRLGSSPNPWELLQTPSASARPLWQSVCGQCSQYSPALRFVLPLLTPNDPPQSSLQPPQTNPQPPPSNRQPPQTKLQTSSNKPPRTNTQPPLTNPQLQQTNP